MFNAFLKKNPAIHLWLALSLTVYSVATIAITDAVKHFEIITFNQDKIFEADTTLFVVLPTIIFLLTTYLYFEILTWMRQLRIVTSLIGLVFFFLSALGSLIGVVQFQLFNIHFYWSAMIYITFQEQIPDINRLFIFSEILVNVVFMILLLFGTVLMRQFFTWHREVLLQGHKHHMSTI